MAEPETNTQAAIDAGKELGGIEAHVGGLPYKDDIPVAFLPRGSTLAVLDQVIAARDKRAPTPRRKVGTSSHTELESFIAHVLRNKVENESVIFANTKDTELVAIYNYHQPAGGEPAWGDHRATYDAPLSDPWNEWNERGGDDEMSQDAFGDFIDAHLEHLVAPSAEEIANGFANPADVLTMARNLTIKTKGDFSRMIDPNTGQKSLVYKTEHDTGSTKIPRAFAIGIPVFEAGKAYKIEVRVYFDINGGRPTFRFALHRASEIMRDAFNEIRDEVREKTGVPMFAGSPEGA